MKGKVRRAFLAVTCLVLLTGCITQRPPQPTQQSESAVEFGKNILKTVSRTAMADIQPVAFNRGPSGSGYISYDISSKTLTAQQESLLTDFMDMYYRSIGSFNADDPGDLFSTKDAAESQKEAWEVIITVRKGAESDLSLTAFSYQLAVTGIETVDDGDLTVSVRENAVQNFAAFPGISSESFNVVHRFTLTNTRSGWKIRSHSQMDSATRLASGRSGGSEGSSSNRQALLTSHSQNRSARKQQIASYDAGAAPGLTWDHDYNRDAALSYATEWVGKRNSDQWATYDRNGGNCANYTSQCLYAGGIPMDYYGASQWKWYGTSPNTAQAATGRSGSWSGVNEFYSYVRSNTGYGLVAVADANWASGEKGDLIQLGYEDSWRHVVIISQVIRDSDGKGVDYLINSNTADLRNFPVSAYMYPQQRLIKIYGWNDA